MRLKLYRAPSVAAAMAQVRADLGPEALILATRRTGDGVELTAALEVPSAPPPPPPDPGRAASLAWHGVPHPLAQRLAAGPVETALAAHLKFGKLALKAGSAPLILAGPPGGGKTLTAARLVTRLVMAGQAPMVITADGRRAGAAEQLAAFTRLLGLTLIVASEPVALARALARRQDGVPVLIDSAGLDPFDAADRQELASLATAAAAEIALVLPAGLDPAESADIATGFASAGATMLVATRLDLARRLGGILAAAACGYTLVEAGVGPGAADGLCALTPTLLAQRLAAAQASPLLDAA